MIARRLRDLARTAAAIANDIHVDDVKPADYIPEPLRTVAAGWADALLTHTIDGLYMVGSTLRRLSDALHGDRSD